VYVYVCKDGEGDGGGEGGFGSNKRFFFSVFLFHVLTVKLVKSKLWVFLLLQ